MPAIRLSKEKRALAIMALSEGTSVSSAARMAGVSVAALVDYFREAGEACELWHDENFRNLPVKRLEIDEQWSYVFKHKERMTLVEMKECPNHGDSWFWAALDADSKAIVGWRTAKRNAEACMEFCNDLASRVPGEVQITSDALRLYRFCIPRAFGSRVHYATEKKDFVHDPKGWKPDANYLKKRVDPLAGVIRQVVHGKPDLDTATVCHVERYFLTVRQHNKRTARKTAAYSKKWDNHAATASLHCFIYNMMRKHTSLNGKTPAQVLGITDKRWTAEMLVAMVDERRKAAEDTAFLEAFNQGSFVSAPTTPRKYAIKKPWVRPTATPAPTPKADWSGVPESWKHPQQKAVEGIYKALGGQSEIP
jgi:IS1 family transposase